MLVQERFDHDEAPRIPLPLPLPRCRIPQQAAQPGLLNLPRITHDDLNSIAELADIACANIWSSGIEVSSEVSAGDAEGCALYTTTT
jgi:hypothetical protein